MKKLKIGIYGGTFDPPHNMHLKVAQAALEVAQLDLVYWVVAAQSPLKTKKPLASEQQRLAMVRLCIAGESRFIASDIEIQRAHKSYSIQTILDLQALHPQDQLYWILGEDQWNKLPQWVQIEELARHVIFLVYPRDHDGGLKPIMINNLRYQLLDAHPSDLCATHIRAQRQQDLDWHDHLPLAVADYIKINQLYQLQ